MWPLPHGHIKKTQEWVSYDATWANEYNEVHMGSREQLTRLRGATPVVASRSHFDCVISVMFGRSR